MKFGDAAIAIYKHHGALLFAIGRDLHPGEVGTFDSEQIIAFCPFQTNLQGGERAYLITGNSRAAKRVGRFEFNAANASHPSFWNEFEIANHMKKSIVAGADQDLDQRQTVGVVALASARDLDRSSQFGSSTSLEAGPATIRSLNQKGRFDFTVIKQKSKEGGTEEEAPALLNTTTPTTFPQPPTPTADDFRLGFTLPALVEMHYLYCILGHTFPSNLQYFVSPIRQKDKCSPIVFLCQSSPAPEDWDILNEYGNVYYIVGSPLLRRDLRKAKVKKAIRTICFADPSQMNVVDRAADSPILLTLLNIQAMSTNDDEYANFVTVEFIHTQNMKLIGNYNHSIREGAATEVLELDMQNIIPAFAGGHVFSSSMFHSILCQAFYEHNLIPVLKMFLFDAGGGENHTSAPNENTSSFFFQMELPLDSRFTGMPFGSLFTLLMRKYQVMIIGLYRQSVNDANGKKFQYVFLNPSCDTKIEDDDLIFAIGVEKPLWD